MRLGRARLDAEVFEERLADEVRRLALGIGDAKGKPMPRFTDGSRKWTGMSCAWQSVKCRKLTCPNGLTSS